MEKAHKILEEKAVRITPMRQLLLEYFLQNNGTFGLIELENAFPKSDRITMYRTLKTFEEKGIIHGHHIDQHPHFQCEQCKQVTCIDSVVVPKMELPKGYVSKEMTMMIKGLCPDCQELINLKNG